MVLMEKLQFMLDKTKLMLTTLPKKDQAMEQQSDQILWEISDQLKVFTREFSGLGHKSLMVIFGVWIGEKFCQKMLKNSKTLVNWVSFGVGSSENGISDSIPILILGNHWFQNFMKGTHVKIESE